MPPSDESFEKLAAALKSETGSGDRTLVEYVWSLRSKGREAVRHELAGFQTGFVDRILSILGLGAPATEQLRLGSVYEGEVDSVSSQGVIVELNSSSSLDQDKGLLPLAQPNGLAPALKRGEKVRVKVRERQKDGSLDLEYAGRTEATEPTRAAVAKGTVSTGDEFELQQLQASGHQASEPRKSRSHFDVVVERGVPDFLRGQLNVDSYGGRTAAESKKTNYWLDKSAEHTSSKVSEASAHSRQANVNNQSGARGSKGRAKMTKSKANSASSVTKKQLPVNSFHLEILQSVAEAPVVIIVGDTGSGKTTQITQFLHGAGYADSGRLIACTQPRRLAAISIAQRVADEMQAGDAGGLVGYSVRFDAQTSSETRIKYMTDGILQREIVSDPDLSEYSVIMLDEAHERTIATDVLFALLKAAVARRPDLRVIVTSATLDAARFAAYFGGAPILRIPGRTFPVDIEWAQRPVLDYMEEALKTVKYIHETKSLEENPRDILVFLTGQAEIDLATNAISQSYQKGDLIPIPVYAAIPSELQALIFDPAPAGKRKVIFATNIAETSLTIEGIRFVVDPGFSKVQVWDANLGMGMLRVQPISRAQANQRSGRAGRTAPGICYRLYTQHSFETEMASSTVPEIQRSNLGHMVLLLKTMGINDVLHFDFMDPPPKSALVSSLYDLYILGAIDEAGNVTALGRQMSRFPLDPALAKVLISAQARGSWCLEDVLTIIAMLSMPSVFYRPSRPALRQKEADQAHLQFHDISGDHLTLLNVFNKWTAAGSNRKWCESHYLQYRNLIKVKDARKQLADLVKQGGSEKSTPSSSCVPSWKERKGAVLETLCSGYFQNVATSIGGEISMRAGDYTTLSTKAQVSIHPSSVMYRRNAAYVLYNSLVMTSREYMHVVSEIRPEWLIEAAPHFWRKADAEDLKKRQRVDSLQPLHNKHARHENEWRVSEQRKTLFSGKRG